MLQLFWIAVAAGLILLATTLRSWLPAIVAGLLVAAGAIWILVSVLYPSSPDRTCPRCREQGLVKIRRGEPGVRCERCGFQDETLHVAYLDDW